VERYGDDAYENPSIPDKGPDGVKYPSEGRQGFVRQIVHYSSGIGTQSALASDSTFAGAFGKGKPST
jgi:hypothetical protein